MAETPAPFPAFHSRRSLAGTPEAPQAGPAPLRLEPDRGDTRLLDGLGAEYAAHHGLLPLGRRGAVTLVAAESAEVFADHRSLLEARLGPVAFVPASREAVHRAISRQRGPGLAAAALQRTAARESCRDWSRRSTGAVLMLAAAAFLLAGRVAPGALVMGLTLWATVTLMAVTGLRTLGALVQIRAARELGQTWHSRRPEALPDAALPTITVLVPLLREREIAGTLIRRLAALDYPADRLEALLILEAGDETTAAAVAAAELPPWCRAITVPPGPLATKPRAMNYALDFARGEIIGIYDAEDAPAPDQLRRAAEAFARVGPEVACLQGVLDFYNTRQSWLTRCFTIDYATWFRLVLPGLVRLGLVIPLGGTTVFLRRDVLEKIGRWDAHNVTEDADLGIRLARRGYRTEFFPSVTNEEATATLGAWVRQRSRWIKGYAMTWAVHMRRPLRLWRELGAWRFFGFQALFLGTLSQFLLAPLLWSFWLVLFGLPHPVTAVAPWPVVLTLAALFLLAEVATLAVAALSVATPRHRRLIWWVPLLHLYFPLSAVACWKALAELVTRPFFWDKTAHGHSLSGRARPAGLMSAPHPA